MWGSGPLRDLTTGDLSRTGDQPNWKVVFGIEISETEDTRPGKRHPAE